MIAKTPKPPYYAVIFTSHRADEDPQYDEMSKHMLDMAQTQPGFLGFESARENLGVAVSYWADLESIKKWKTHTEHLAAQKRGREQWYSSFKVRIAKIERDYER